MGSKIINGIVYDCPDCKGSGLDRHMKLDGPFIKCKTCKGSGYDPKYYNIIDKDNVTIK